MAVPGPVHGMALDETQGTEQRMAEGNYKLKLQIIKLLQFWKVFYFEPYFFGLLLLTYLPIMYDLSSGRLLPLNSPLRNKNRL